MKSLFTCPVCCGLLEKSQNRYICPKNHSFDIAKEGYVNLVPVTKKRSVCPGDDRDMVASRTRFLEGGYYRPLRDEVCGIIGKIFAKEPVLLDSGCGEGYYTKEYCRVIKEMGGHAVGIDLSKAAIRHASKLCPDGEFGVASVYHIPMSDLSADVIVNCFSPLAIEEFSRILRKDGIFIYIVPDEKHLWELKQVLYDVPYLNEVKNQVYDGFELIEARLVKTRFTLNSTEEILSLLGMTPYNWKTPRDGREKLLQLSTLEVGAEFRVLVYKKL